jgi:uncharacterized membrane protein
VRATSESGRAAAGKGRALKRRGWIVGVLWLSACGSGTADTPLPGDACASDGGPAPVYSQVDAFKACVNCHSSALSGSARHDAPAEINFDTYEAAKAHAEDAAQLVQNNAMPPANSKLTLTQTEKDDLYRWVQCGTPNG